MNRTLHGFTRAWLAGSIPLAALAAFALAAPDGDVAVAGAQTAGSAAYASSSGAASASASASASAPALPPPPAAFKEPPMAAREWPASESAEPSDEEWAAAPVLRVVKRTMLRVREWSSGHIQVECSERAIREWMRVTCEPDHSGYRDHFFGVVWGLAGDMANARASITPASTLPKYQAGAQDPQLPITRLFGASATLTFRVKRGAALLLGVDHIQWVDNYDSGPSLGTKPGLVIDVSWAHGEAGPTVSYQ